MHPHKYRLYECIHSIIHYQLSIIFAFSLQWHIRYYYMFENVYMGKYLCLHKRLKVSA